MSELRIPHAISHPRQKRGPKPTPKPPCIGCGKPLSQYGKRYCSVLCANRHKPPRASKSARPQQNARKDVTPVSVAPSDAQDHPHMTSVGDGLATYRKPRKPWPMGDPELCVHPARPVDYFDGYAIVAEWAKLGISGQHIVRGWTGSVDENATGLVFPKFERKETAALFDQMVDNKTGRRAS